MIFRSISLWPGYVEDPEIEKQAVTYELQGLTEFRKWEKIRLRNQKLLEVVERMNEQLQDLKAEANTI